ncbi:MAG: hypothetical protein HUK15_01065, partial [Bacteroidales bacterium]|nr:hypothetical protein [Bacteroidales bacterium]
AIENAEVVEKTINAAYSLSFTYNEMNFVMKCIRDFDAKILSQDFAENCVLNFSVRLSLEEQIVETLSKNYNIIIKKL